MRVKITNLIAFLSLALFCLGSIGTPLSAQDTPQNERPKPQLVPITIHENNSDKDAESIIRKIYETWAKEEKKQTDIGKIHASFLPLAKENSDDKFIFGILYDEPYGGCFSRGCQTVILHSKGDNQWVGVFRAFVHFAWYDETSTARNHANLIFSSNIDKSNPGVWMWNGTGYQIANKR